MSLRGAAAIIGFAELPTQRATPGRSALGMMGQLAREVVADAHIRKEDVDGLVTEGGNVYPAQVIEYLGMKKMRYASGVSMMGASGASAIAAASMAVQNGLANYVMVVITTARDPAVQVAGGGGGFAAQGEFEEPYGMSAGANTGYAMVYNRHMYEYGTTQEQLAHIAVNQRFNTLLNPNSAFQGQPITLQDVMSSRYVNYPLRLLECVMPCGGGAAVIVTTAERAKAALNKPVYLLGAGIGVDAISGWVHDRLVESPVARSAPIAFAMSGYTPRDIQFAEFYD